MAISKIILNGVTQIDLTSDTVQASNLIAPNTAHGANGEAIVGTANGGVDVPIFTIVRDPNTGNATSITCNKTFAQCLDYGENGYGWTLLHEVVDEEEYYGTTIWYSQDSSHIIFSAMDGLYPSYDIQFNSNGTIALTEPSAQNTTMNITENGDYYPAGYTSLVHVAVASSSPSLQAKTNIAPTTSSQTITADNGYDGLSSVQINAMPTMTLPTSASSTSSGTSKGTIGRSTAAQYINIPTGYNGTASYYTISATPNGSATTPTTTITANPSITVSSSGLITATTSASQNITPTVSAGYVSSGTTGTVTVSGSKTQQLTTKGATTITPTKSTQTAIASGVYTTGAITVAAIPSNYITTTDATASASDILSGETAYVNGSKVTGTLTFSTVTVSSSTPSGGSSGDIWIQV